MKSMLIEYDDQDEEKPVHFRFTGGWTMLEALGVLEVSKQEVIERSEDSGTMRSFDTV